MSIVAAVAVALSLIAAPAPAQARPLSLAAPGDALEHSTQHAVAARRLHMSVPPLRLCA